MKKLIKFFILIIVVFLSILLYGRFIGTKNIITKEYKIINSNLTNDYYGLKIVHISDIHYGRITHKKELKELVDKVNKTKPDIVVFTGDLVDKDTELSNEQADEISSILSKINVTVDKFAITGDHDIKLKNWNLIIENAGFKNLNDTYETIYLESDRFIVISGLSSNLNNQTDIKDRIKTTEEFLKGKEKPIYSILLMHEPDYVKDIDLSNYNLVLAGHSHNKQVNIPINPSLPKGAKKYYKAHYKIKQTDLYISGGIGTSSYNFRLRNKPSFNLYRMVNK